MAALAALSAIAGCKPSGEAAAPMQMPPPLVVTVAAESRDVPVYLDEIGRTAASEQVTITPQVDGPIMAIHFKDGQNIQKGDLLYNIDPRPYQAVLDQAKAKLVQDQVSLDFAKQEFDRVDSLKNTQVVSREDYDTKKNNWLGGQAQVASSEAAVRTAELELSYCTIKSPITGRAGTRLVDIGNIVKTNETALLTIQNLKPTYVYFTINEDQLSAVRDHMASGTLETHVTIPGETGTGRTGKLTFLDNTVQSATGTVRLRAEFPNTDLHFWPGQFVNVRLVLYTDKNAVLIPQDAAQISQAGPFVMVVDSGMKAQMRPIVRGQPQGDWVVVTSGVKAGEQVITDGQMMVRDGATVRLAPPPPPAAPAATQSASAGGDK